MSEKILSRLGIAALPSLASVASTDWLDSMSAYDRESWMVAIAFIVAAVASAFIPKRKADRDTKPEIKP